MTKSAITDYSGTPSENADLDGVSTLGTNRARFMDDMIRILMSHLADMNTGASPLDDTFRLRNSEDNTRIFGFDGANAPVGYTPIPILPLTRSATPKITTYTSSGTHTFTPGSKKYQIMGVGGGGSGMSVYCIAPAGQTFYAAGAGGVSGQFVTSNIRDIAFDSDDIALTAAIVVGGGGTSSVDSGGTVTRSNGGDTTWTHNSVTLTIPGGTSYSTAKNGANSVDTARAISAGTRATGFIAVGQNIGGTSISGVSGGASGEGASSPYGAGGASVAMPGSSGSTAGTAATGYGSGGSGATACAESGQTRRADGGAGSPGLLIVMEW